MKGRKSMDMTVRVHPTVQALEVPVLARGRVVRCVVSRSVFEGRFGASEATASWLQAFEANKAAVLEAIKHKTAMHPDRNIVVLLEEDFPVLSESASSRPTMAGTSG
jgi:hypothetical protein